MTISRRKFLKQAVASSPAALLLPSLATDRVWALEHRRYMLLDQSEAHDAGWVPCGVFSDVESAMAAAETFMENVTEFSEGWRESAWPDDKAVWYRYYNHTTYSQCGWRIAPFDLNRFELEYSS